MQSVKNIKICAAVLILLAIIIIPACSRDLPNGLPGNISADGDYGRLLEILERAEIYKNLYIDGDENTENLKTAINEAEKLTVSAVMPGKEQIRQVYDKFTEAAAAFEKPYVTGDNNKISDSNAVARLYISGVKCAFDKKSGTFYYTMGKTPEKELKFIFSAENVNGDKIFAEILENGSPKGWKFIPELNKEYILKAETKKSVYSYKIIFTMLPVVQIDSPKKIGDSYKDCVISVTDPDYEYSNGFYFESDALIHVRGGISRGFPKKSYALKFVKGNENNDVRLFNLRNDSDWILDAMYIDKARMRNRASTDIWNSMDSKLYFMKDGQEQTNGTRGVLIEAFLNDEYIGLYCLTEKIDRKQLQLDKNDNGLKSVIYKGKSWSDAILFRRYYKYDNNSVNWDAFEQMYPNPAKGGKIEWKPIADLVNFVVNSSDKEFTDNIDKYIDVQNFVDYTILLCISYAYDNTGKNAYWSCYDMTDENMKKIFLTPWDMDASWGQSWDGSKLLGSADRIWMDSEYEHDTNLFRRLILTNAGGFADKMRETWNRLKTGALSVENILKVFNGYFDLFEISGAWDRERVRWKECDLNIAEERKYIKDWVEARWVYIDDFINNKLDTVGDYAP